MEGDVTEGFSPEKELEAEEVETKAGPERDGRSAAGDLPVAELLERPLKRTVSLDWEKSLYLLLILAAFVTRFYLLGTRVMSHDESLHTYYSWQLYQGRGFVHTPLMHGPLQFHLLAFTYFLFGDSDFTARIPAALFSVAAVALPWFFRRWLGRAGALAASALMLISPYMLYYGRYTRNEAFVVVFGLLTVWAIFRYMETREAKWLYLLSAATALHYATKETSYIYHAVFMLFLGLHLVREIFAVPWPNPKYRRPFALVFWLAVMIVVVAVPVIFYYSGAGKPLGLSATVPVQPAVPGEAGSVPAAEALPALRYAGTAALAAGGLALAGLFLLVGGFGLAFVRRFPALDLLVILGTFVLPQLTAFPVRALGWDPLDYSGAGLQRTALVLVPLAIVSLGIGLLWNWRRWLISAGIFYALFTVFYTTVFTNGGGFFSGLVGSLGYWLVQQGVHRGTQPWYYYLLVQVPVYEFLPALGALFAGYLGFRKWWNAPADKRRDHPISPADTLDFPHLGFVGFWAVGITLGLTLAGEKMPWLTVHVALPLILLAGWSLGRLIEAVNWKKFRLERGWLVGALAPLFLLSLGSAFRFALFGPAPFQGNTLDQLQTTSAFLAALAMAGVFGGALVYAAQGWHWREILRLVALALFGVLGVLTARAAFVASYVNYDQATEYLVYAHAAGGVKEVMAQVEEISQRTTDGLGVEVAYDDDVAWPVTWYMRSFYKQKYYGKSPTREALDVPLVIAGDANWARVEPLLGERYYRYEHIRMWWPMQDYFDLTWERIRSALTDGKMRRALLDIWLSRDYTLYGELTNRSFELSRWPVADRMRFYIRKDIAAQIWDYGVGPTALVEPLPEDPYKDSILQLAAQALWGSQGTAPGQFQTPRAVAAAPDGSIYVADTLNHQIQMLDAEGQPVLAWGSFGDVAKGTGEAGQFNEPWGIAVGPDGSVYVSDTWNHRIQKFSATGQFLTTWGTFGQAETPTSFWGPRGIAVDGQGRVFVSDTGNKRIVVFDSGGGYITQVGETGYEDGKFDEPVGVAVGPQGRLYVADTWNQRVQWFDERAPGLWVYGGQWPIVGWYGQSLENKPYIAVSAEGDVYVSDPEGYRILRFTAEGEFVAVWGDYGTGAGQFGLPAGIALDPSGRLLVVDAANGRVMAFQPGE